MEKVYVNPKKNSIPYYMANFFKLGHTVIVIDGSYMMGENSSVNGVEFKKKNMFELLTITGVNHSFPSCYDGSNQKLHNVLGHHNNCELTGADGKKYYCSHINIRRWEY